MKRRRLLASVHFLVAGSTLAASGGFVPTLIVGAAGSPWTVAFQELHRRIAGSRLERMDGVGHALFVDDPDRFNALLDEFLDDIRH